MDLMWLISIDQRIRALVILLLVVIALQLLQAIQHARSNHYLRSIDRSLKTLPAVSQARNLAAVKNRAVG